MRARILIRAGPFAVHVARALGIQRLVERQRPPPSPRGTERDGLALPRQIPASLAGLDGARRRRLQAEQKGLELPAPGSAATGKGLGGVAAVMVTGGTAAATVAPRLRDGHRVGSAVEQSHCANLNPPTSTPARVSALRHQPMNQDHCTSRRAYSHSQQTGRQCAGSPRAHSGAAKKSSGQLANSAEPWPISCADREVRKRSTTCYRVSGRRAARRSLRAARHGRPPGGPASPTCWPPRTAATRLGRTGWYPS